MTRAISKHGYVALVAMLAWCAAIVVTIVNPDLRSRALAPVLFSSVVTTVGAVLLSRFWIKRESAPSFGTLIVVPFACAFLFVFGPLLWDACRYGEWYLLSPSYYWQDAKGGAAQLCLPLAVLGGICIFPAVAVVVYYQGRKKTDVRHVA
jgi:hypothetical protein